MRRLAVGLVVGAVVMSGCSLPGGGGSRAFNADFSRAVQIFPAVKVRVLGVEVGHVVNVRNVNGGVEVSFVVTDPIVKIPGNVQAAVPTARGSRSTTRHPSSRTSPRT